MSIKIIEISLISENKYFTNLKKEVKFDMFLNDWNYVLKTICLNQKCIYNKLKNLCYTVEYHMWKLKISLTISNFTKCDSKQKFQFVKMTI